jgi:hypothetical protein
MLGSGKMLVEIQIFYKMVDMVNNLNSVEQTILLSAETVSKNDQNNATTEIKITMMHVIIIVSKMT